MKFVFTKVFYRPVQLFALVLSAVVFCILNLNVKMFIGLDVCCSCNLSYEG